MADTLLHVDAYASFLSSHPRPFSYPCTAPPCFSRHAAFLATTELLKSPNPSCATFTFNEHSDHTRDMIEERAAEYIPHPPMPETMAEGSSDPNDPNDPYLHTLLPPLHPPTPGSLRHLTPSSATLTYIQPTLLSLLFPPPHPASLSLPTNPSENQGLCGSCYAFAAAASTESVLSLQHIKATHTKAHDKHDLAPLLPPLSVQQLISCDDSGLNNGCVGGNPLFSYQYMTGGVTTGAVYPYENGGKDVVRGCRIGDGDRRSNAVVTLTEYGIVEPNNVDLIISLLNTHGPIAAGMYGTSRHFLQYESGVFDDVWEECVEGVMNHAVVITGYGEDEVGGPYWLVRNSWGTDFGEGGFFKIKRTTTNGPGVCGIQSSLSLAIAGTVNFDNLDNLGAIEEEVAISTWQIEKSCSSIHISGESTLFPLCTALGGAEGTVVGLVLVLTSVLMMYFLTCRGVTHDGNAAKKKYLQSPAFLTSRGGRSNRSNKVAQGKVAQGSSPRVFGSSMGVYMPINRTPESGPNTPDMRRSNSNGQLNEPAAMAGSYGAVWEGDKRQAKKKTKGSVGVGVVSVGQGRHMAMGNVFPGFDSPAV